MARQARLQYKGAFYHVTSRGNAQSDIYLDDGDRLEFLNVLRKARNRYNVVIYAYCLMDNHYHLLIETPDGNLSQFMRQLNSVYTQRFNANHGRVGHVFQGRYKSFLVQKDLYLLELSRYIVLNPVRAEMVRSAKDWPWSSYRETAGLSTPVDWVESNELLLLLSKRRSIAMKAYRRFVSEGRNQAKPWKQLRNQVLLGDEAFITQSKILLEKEDNSEIPLKQTRFRAAAKPISYYEARAGSQKEAMREVYASGGYTMKQIGQHFGVHYSTVSRVINANG